MHTAEVLTTFDCGCELISENLDYDSGVRYCPLHSAAPDLLAALEALKVPPNTHGHDDEWCWCRCVNSAHDTSMPKHHPKCQQARAAIAKAKGIKE